MAREVFTDAIVGEFYNKNFVSIKVNAEKGFGIDFVKRYPVAGYPTLMYFENSGEIKSKITAYADITKMMQLGKKALVSNKEIQALHKKYLSGDIKTNELYKYLLVVIEKGDPFESKKVFEKFVKSYKADPSDLNKETTDQFIKRFYLNEFREKRGRNNEAYQKDKQELLSKVDLPDKEVLNLDINHFYNNQNEDAFVKVGNEMFEKYLQEDDKAISNLLGAVMFVKKEINLKVCLTP